MTNWYYEETRARDASEAFAKQLQERELVRRLEDASERRHPSLRRRLAALIVGLGAWLDPESIRLQGRVLAAEPSKARLR